MLLDVENPSEQGNANDMTVEGANILVEKIGEYMDNKIAQLEAGIKLKAQEGQPVEKAASSRDQEVLTKLNKVFARFEALTEPVSVPQLSNRIKLLIKNMLDDRSKGWERTKKQNEKKPMKVEELWKETQKKLEQEQAARMLAEEEEQSYLGGSHSGGNRHRGDRQRGGKQDYNSGQGGKYQPKDQSKQSQPTGGKGGQGKREEYNKPNSGLPKNPTSAPAGGAGTAKIVPIENPAMEKLLIQNFTAYVNSKEAPEEGEEKKEAFSLQLYKDLQTINGKKGGEIFYYLLNKAFDQSAREIEEILPEYVLLLAKEKVLDAKSFQIGVSKFLQNYPNIVSDIPKLPEWFSNVLLPLHQQSIINFKELKWVEKKESGAEDDDLPMVDDYFRLVAAFLFAFHTKGKASLQGLNSFMATSGFGAQLKAFQPQILEDNLFADILDTYTALYGNEKNARIIVHLLQGDEEGFKRDSTA